MKTTTDILGNKKVTVSGSDGRTLMSRKASIDNGDQKLINSLLKALEE